MRARAEAAASSGLAAPATDPHREAALALLRPDPRIADALRLLPSPARPSVGYWVARAKALTRHLPEEPARGRDHDHPFAPPARPDDWRLELDPAWPELRARALAQRPDLIRDVDFVGRWRGLLTDREPDAAFVLETAVAVRDARARAAAA